VPLFIFVANLMNASGVLERLLVLAQGAGRTGFAGASPRQHPGEPRLLRDERPALSPIAAGPGSSSPA